MAGPEHEERPAAFGGREAQDDPFGETLGGGTVSRELTMQSEDGTHDTDVEDTGAMARAAEAKRARVDPTVVTHEYIVEESSHPLDFYRQNLSVVILEPADGEVLWTEDLGASFDVVLEIHGGGLNFEDRGARIDADAFVELNGHEIWHGDGSLNSAELSIWHSRVTVEVADDGTILHRFTAPHVLTARLVDGTDEIASVTHAFEVARSTGGQGWAKATPYASPWASRGRAGLRYLNSVAIAFAREIEKLEACLQDRGGMKLLPTCPYANLERVYSSCSVQARGCGR